MRPRFAYWTKEPYSAKGVTTIPQRLRDAWPNLPGDGNQRWMAQGHPSGVGTLIVFPAYDGSSVTLADFGDPRETHDGMTYYPSKDAPDKDWLIRPEDARPLGEWVKIQEGELYVSVAMASARRLVLSAAGGYKAGAYVSEFGRLGHDIYDDFVSADGLKHETFIGGKSRFMHKDKRATKITGTGGAGKAAVMGLLERHGPDGHSVVRAKVVNSRRAHALTPEVRRNVVPGAEVFSDALGSYSNLKADYVHQVIDHAESYVDGQIHTNGIENFWSLLKRALKGTYVSVEPFHWFRYLDEETFRFNTRHETDGDRFQRLGSKVAGKRLTYAQLTGAVGTTQ